MPMLWIQSRVDYKRIYPRSYLRQLSNSKHNLVFNILQRVWILQSLNTIRFNNLPLFDEDKTLMLVLFLIESEVVPAKHSFKQKNKTSDILLAHKQI